MKVIFCDPEGNVEDEDAGTRLLDLTKFHKTEAGARILAETPNGVVEPLPGQLTPKDEGYKLTVTRLIFNHRLLDYIVQGSEEKRVEKVNAHINKVPGAECYAPTNRKSVWTYLAALIILGIIGTKNVEDALTRRKNLETRNKKGKMSKSGARSPTNSKPNMLFAPGPAKLLSLRKYRMLQDCIRPYLGAYEKERARFSKMFNSFEAQVEPSAPKMKNPLESNNRREAFSWKTNGVSQII